MVASVLHITACKGNGLATVIHTMFAEEALARGTLEVNPGLLDKLRQLAASGASAADGTGHLSDSESHAHQQHQPGQPSSSNGSTPAPGLSPAPEARSQLPHCIHQMAAGCCCCLLQMHPAAMLGLHAAIQLGCRGVFGI